ncbi:unnamed protein product [Mytilus coruscus]|uniref:LRP2 n=1 Tax=Mytilus coruscus TaxID=42192 RepID=A0A6J8AM83_MYTCO|nr:unnamed protein product [Mytilus coruscus]
MRFGRTLQRNNSWKLWLLWNKRLEHYFLPLFWIKVSNFTTMMGSRTLKIFILTTMVLAIARTYYKCLDGYIKCRDGQQCISIADAYAYARKCDDGAHCVYEADMCNGFQTCPDGSDEAPQNCTKDSQCQYGLWKCANGVECIYEMHVCDNWWYCSDKSDENPQLCTQEPNTSYTISVVTYNNWA